jgi:protein-tyrosine phosphatase
MIDTAKSFDIDISKLSARQFTTDDFDNFDKIFVMDSENYKNVVSLAKDKSQIDKVQYTLSDQKDVPDPYFGGQQGFVRVYEMLYNACQNISDDL